MMCHVVLNLVLSLLLCRALAGPVSGKALSKPVLDLFSIANGRFDNLKQTEIASTEHAFVKSRIFPVYLPKLHPTPILFAEWSIEDRVSTIELLIPKNGGQGDKIFVDIFSFTDPGLYKPGEFNVSSLSELTPEKLKGGNCTGVFVRVRRGVYAGIWSECTHVSKGENVYYTTVFVCNRIVFNVPRDLAEIYAPTPYITDRIGDRYPTPGIPDNFNSLCIRNK